jgi:hypothetical protein
MDIATRLLIVLGAYMGTASACSCRGLDVENALANAEIVFRGTVVNLHPSNEPQKVRFEGRDYRIAVFRVERVWKGEIGSVFEMPALEETTDCVGFWPGVVTLGSDLLVYASRQPPYRQYVTNICTRTSTADRAAADLKILGRGRSPGNSN